MRRLQHSTTRRSGRWAALLSALILCIAPYTLRAQEQTSLMLDVNPTQDILPPQVGDYKSNPGKYFTVSLINQTADELQVYLAVQIEQLADNNNVPQSLSLSSPPSRMPGSPIVVPAHGTTNLTMEQMRRIFDHIPLSEMHFSNDVFSNFGSAAFGLLPEGFYRIRLTAYKWDPLRLNPSTNMVDDPVALSNADITGIGLFRICYRAQAPVFTTPQASMAEPNSAEPIKFPLTNPVFMWSEPTLNCWRDNTPMYQYTLSIYKLYDGADLKQTPEEALHNPVVFRVQGISAPQYRLNYNHIRQLLDGQKYVAQVEAKPLGVSEMNFTMVENEGKSPIIVFTPQMSDDIGDTEWDDEEEEEEEDEFDLSLLGITTEIGEGDSLYVFRVPEVYKPDFDGNTNRTLFAGNTLNSAWHRPVFVGGTGEQQDTLKFRYRAELYALSGYANAEEALEHEPLYSGIVKGPKSTSDASDTTDTGKSGKSGESGESGESGKPQKAGSTGSAETLEQVQEQLGELRELKALFEKQAAALNAGLSNKTIGNADNSGDSGDSGNSGSAGSAGKAGRTGKTGNRSSGISSGLGNITPSGTIDTSSDPELTQVERDRLDKLKAKYGITSVAACQSKITELEEKERNLKAEAENNSGKGGKGGKDSDTADKAGVDVLEDYIPWSDLAGKVSVGQALLLRIVPECVNETSVRFFGDVNQWPLQYSDKLSEAFGDACGGGTIEENRVPIDISEKEMRGKTVHVGEYDMKMNDDVKLDSKTKTWSGTAFLTVKLKYPKDAPFKLGVKFQGIAINSDYIMYDGVVQSDTKSNWDHLLERAKEAGMDYSDPSQLKEWIPDDIFTDWGLDNLVGYCTPDALKEYMEQDVENAKQGINSLGRKIKASKYYDYVRRGYATYRNLWDNGLNIDDDVLPEVFMPLQISDIYETPVDVQILSMEFHPTTASMNLLGMFTLDDNDITEDNILIFGAPRVCLDPERLLPGSGYVTLLSDVKLNDPNSTFSFNFKAPKDLKDPKDGCYLTWANDTLSGLNLHVEMEIPNLIKCDDKGEVVEGQVPIFTAKAFVKDWYDWTAAISMDPFTHKDVKGYVFTAQEVTYDHSQVRNPAGITFPDKEMGYDLDEAGIIDGDMNTWQGFYVKALEVRFPACFISDHGISFSANNMLIDQKGVTMAMNINDLVDVNLDGWAMRLKHIFMNVVQNKFKKCGFSGDMHVPLMNENIDFTCDLYPVSRDDGSTDFDCILKIDNEEQMKNVRFDFLLAELELTNKQSYFLLESRAGRAEGEERKTRVEMCLAGDITIGGTADANDWLKEKLKDVPLKLSIPGIHFTQMRLANCKRWLSDAKYPDGQKIADMQKAAADKANDSKSGGVTWYTFNQENKECWFGDKFVFETGIWSVASYEKTIGMFHFGIKDYKVSKLETEKDMVGFGITGRVALVDKPGSTTKTNSDVEKNALVCADLSLWIDCNVDVKNFDLTYKEVRFEELTVNANFLGLSLKGSLTVKGPESKDKGYGGSLAIKLPGDLITFEADGGFFEHKPDDGDTKDQQYKWGYFYLGVGGKMGIEITPLKITKIGAGVFINCYAEKEDKSKVKPQHGLIGVMADMGLSSSDGEVIKGDMHLSVLYDRDHDRLTTFLFTGGVKAVADMIDANVTIRWQNDDENKYFQLTATVDVSADAGTLLDAAGKAIGADEIAADLKRASAEIEEKFKLINDKYMPPIIGPTGTLQGKMDDNSGATAGHKTTANTKDSDDDKAKSEAKAKMGGHVSLDLKITFREKGVNYNKVRWHVYLGEPAKDKRCSYTLIDFKSKIVTVNIGNDFYVCVGNELPNNGELPPIPEKIQKFLTGESKGGVEGASVAKAEKARKKALKVFSKDAEIDGGVMGGASAWGFVEFDLGIFYGDMGATAGFDVAFARLKYNDCPGEKDGTMGYKHWYAEGQLYAYLYAKFGIHVDLGFWDKKFDIIDAGIGGVLRCGLPSPSYFVGDVRIKLNLLGGLVKLNRRFQFECGHVCNIFYGNPLDNFEMFGDCTIGTTNHLEGWAKDAELVSPYLTSKPQYFTQVPIGEHFRVLDENTLHQLEEDYEGDVSDLEMQSKRTFVFRQDADVELFTLGERQTQWLSLDSGAMQKNYETLYNKFHNNNSAYRKLVRRTEAQTRFRLDDIKKYLEPDMYYVIAVRGTAKEIRKGKEVDPLVWDTIEHRWVEDRPWIQYQLYYFRTGSGDLEVEDAADLDPYVALSYPSHEGEIRTLGSDDVFEKKDNEFSDLMDATIDTISVVTYLDDARHPNIALTQQVFYFNGGKRVAKEGYPYGYIYPNGSNILWVSHGKHKNGTKFHKVNQAQFFTNSSSQNITGNLTHWEAGDEGTLSLVYKYYEKFKVECVDTTYRTVTNTVSSGSNYSSSAYGYGQQSNGLTGSGGLMPTHDPNLPFNANGNNNSSSGRGNAIYLGTFSTGSSTSTGGKQINSGSTSTGGKQINSGSTSTGGNTRGGGITLSGLTATTASAATEQPEPVTEMVVTHYTRTDSIEKYKVLYSLRIKVIDGNWKTGYHPQESETADWADEQFQLTYSRPFVGMKLTNIEYAYDVTESDYDLLMVDDTDRRLRDPYYYLSYLANYFFIGGYPITAYAFDWNDNAYGEAVPMAESMIYYGKGGQTSGNFANKENNIAGGRRKYYNLSVFDRSQYLSAYGEYPLPRYDDINWTPLVNGSERVPVYYPGRNVENFKNLLAEIAAPYYLAETLSSINYHVAGWNTDNPSTIFELFARSAWPWLWAGLGNYKSQYKSEWKKMFGDHTARYIYKSQIISPFNNYTRGMYMTVNYSWNNGRKNSRDTISVQIPTYQFPLLLGSLFESNNDTRDMTLSYAIPTSNTYLNKRKDVQLSRKLWYRFSGSYSATYGSNMSIQNARWLDSSDGYTKETFNAKSGLRKIKGVDVSAYRVNCYNWNLGQYTVLTNLPNEVGPFDNTYKGSPYTFWENKGTSSWSLLLGCALQRIQEQNQ